MGCLFPMGAYYPDFMVLSKEGDVCYNHCCWTTTIASYWHLHLILFTAGKLRCTGIFFLHFTCFTTHDITVYNLLTVVTMSNLIGKSMNEPHTCFSQMWGAFMITPFIGLIEITFVTSVLHIYVHTFACSCAILLIGHVSHFKFVCAQVQQKESLIYIFISSHR